MRHPYRPEIDGLRTVAVMLVILHHLGWALLSGGYVGVDVFFVISGYLISTILLEEIRTGHFSLAQFYKRRIIRLAPAYFIVLAATTFAALLFMLPAEILNYSKSTIYSTLFLSNFYMWKEVGGYFGGLAEYVPQLHLWSLAVEEQFYIFWPILFWAIYKVLGKRWLILSIALLIFFGVGISEYGVQKYRAAAYYLIPTRFFELMLGALIAVLPQYNKSGSTSNVLEFVGLGLIAWSAVTYTTERFFPGFWALVPCMGAVLLIYFGKANQGVGRMLALPSMVYLGKISYPAYLWHWPIIAYLNLNRVEINVSVGTVVILSTLILAALTHQFTEIPFRRMHAFKFGKVFAFGFSVPALAAIIFSVVTNENQGFPGRFSEALNLRSAAVLSATYKARGRCNEGNVTNPLGEDSCILGVANRPVDFLLVGDSHANHFTGMLDVMAKEAGVRGYDITQSQTPYLPGVSRYYLQEGQLVEHWNFKPRNDKLTDIITHNHYKAVVLAGSFETYAVSNELKMDLRADHVFEAGMRAAIRQIQNSGARAILINDNPSTGSISFDCTLQNARFGTNHDCTVPIENYRAAFAKWSVILMRLRGEFPDMLVIDPADIICQKTSCNTEISGIPLYRDGGHLNQMGSELIGKLYIEKFDNPLSFLGSSPNSQK